MDQLIRTQLLIGQEGIEKLWRAHVLIVGIGGVGGYALEALVRSGIGKIDVMDHDTIDISNLNRQIMALHSTLGRKKVDVAKERATDINPAIKIKAYPVFYTPQIGEKMDFSLYDYVIDAIDNVTGKIDLVLRAQKAGVPVISAMGAGNKMNPQDLGISDLYATKGCPLARVMRKELKKRDVHKLKVICSTELPLAPLHSEKSEEIEGKTGRERVVPGSNAFVPAAAGLMIGAEVVKDIIKWKGKGNVELKGP